MRFPSKKPNKPPKAHDASSPAQTDTSSSSSGTTPPQPSTSDAHVDVPASENNAASAMQGGLHVKLPPTPIINELLCYLQNMCQCASTDEIVKNCA